MEQNFSGIRFYPKKLAEALDDTVWHHDSVMFRMAESILACEATVFVCGNGGSAAIANHFSCDYLKGVVENSNLKSIRAISLSSNIPLITAIGNDLGYDEVFAYQYKQLSDHEYDILIVISSSGNSPNIVKVVKEALSQGKRVFGIVGFDGGIVKQLCKPTHIIHIRSNNYGIVEDCSQAIMHMVAQQIILWNQES